MSKTSTKSYILFKDEEIGIKKRRHKKIIPQVFLLQLSVSITTLIVLNKSFNTAKINYTRTSKII
jgi:hypothetical protein